MKIRSSSSAAAIALAALMLAGCASDDQTARFFVAPGKYVLYSCDELARQAQGLAARQKELEQLMVKSSTDVTGRMIGDAAYRPDYIMARGELTELRKTAAEKNCNPMPDPGNPTGRASDRVIR